MTSMDSNLNFQCGRPHGVEPLPVHIRPPEPDPSPAPCGRHKWMAPNTKIQAAQLNGNDHNQPFSDIVYVGPTQSFPASLKYDHKIPKQCYLAVGLYSRRKHNKSIKNSL